MITKHTEGPWDYEPEDGTHERGSLAWKTRIYSRDPGPEHDFHIAIVREVDKSTRDANARLIAAAPDLLEALTWAMGHVTPYKHRIKGQNETYCDSYDAALAAIAKATGEDTI